MRIAEGCIGPRRCQVKLLRATHKSPSTNPAVSRLMSSVPPLLHLRQSTRFHHWVISDPRKTLPHHHTTAQRTAGVPRGRRPRSCRVTRQPVQYRRLFYTTNARCFLRGSLPLLAPESSSSLNLKPFPNELALAFALALASTLASALTFSNLSLLDLSSTYPYSSAAHPSFSPPPG